MFSLFRLKLRSCLTNPIKVRKWKTISTQKVTNFLMKMLTYNCNNTMMAVNWKLIMVVKKADQNQAKNRRTGVEGE